jgi:hypothetical protein
MMYCLLFACNIYFICSALGKIYLSVRLSVHIVLLIFVIAYIIFSEGNLL